MAKVDLEKAAIKIELQQRVAEFGHELDINNGNNITEFYTEDGVFVAGGARFEGHAAIAKFYADRNERVRTQQKDGKRTGRHTFANFRIAVHGDDRATVHYMNVNYSGEGAPPLDLEGPTIVSDCRMEFVCEADGAWRIVEFVPEPIFVGNDSFMNKVLVKK